MCPFFLLPIFFFTIVFIVNSFLWKLLKTYRKNMIWIGKLKSISKGNHPIDKIISIRLLLQMHSGKSSLFSSDFERKNQNQEQDILILGHILKSKLTPRITKNSNENFRTFFSSQFLSTHRERDGL